jgi:hypothetical protein
MTVFRILPVIFRVSDRTALVNRIPSSTLLRQVGGYIVRIQTVGVYYVLYEIVANNHYHIEFLRIRVSREDIYHCLTESPGSEFQRTYLVDHEEATDGIMTVVEQCCQRRIEVPAAPFENSSIEYVMPDLHEIPFGHLGGGVEKTLLAVGNASEIPVTVPHGSGDPTAVHRRIRGYAIEPLE